MNNFQIAIYELGSWNNLDGWVRPFDLTFALDETLDSGSVQVTGSTRSAIIKPYTLIRLTINTTVKYMLVQDAKRTQSTFSGTIKYDWNITLIETTKMLERIPCDTMRFSNYLGHDYADGIVIKPTIQYVNQVWIEGDEIVDNAPNYVNTYVKNATLTIYGAQVKFVLKSGITWYYNTGLPTTNSPQTVTVKNSAGTVVYTQTAYADASGNLNMPSGTIQLTDTSYTIEYTGFICKRQTVGDTLTSGFTATYQIATIEGIAPKTNPTITSIVEKILRSGVTRRVYRGTGALDDIDKQLIRFNAAQAEKYKAIETEYSTTRNTFFEALSGVGEIIHAMPRLNFIDTSEYKGYELVFDELGGNDEYTVPTTAEMTYEQMSLTGDEYCEAIDSVVENILNTTDVDKGAIVEPSTGTYKTVRTERGGYKISADTMRIQTERPIYRLIKLEVLCNGKAGDITAYVYENAEYEALSEYAGAVYPYSKAYALKYTSGQKDITGLTFRDNAVTDLSSAFKNYAIYNIVKQALDTEISDYTALAFRVTYIPLVTARITQSKPYTGWETDFSSNVLISNQGGNMVESDRYGERLKGYIARLGNKQVVRTYNFAQFEDLPQCGQLMYVEDEYMYVSLINANLDQNKVKATILLTPQFNRLSEYVGLNSEYRLYDVSEKQAVERLVNYTEKCYINYRATSASSKVPFIKSDAYYSIFQTLGRRADYDAGEVPTAALVQVNGTWFARTLDKRASGNSLVFEFAFDDNYGVGYQSIPNSVSIDAARIQRLVPYGNVYGEFDTMRVQFVPKAFTNSADKMNSYPAITSEYLTDVYPLFDTSSVGDNSVVYPFLIDKDNKEQINFTYQLNFISRVKSVVLGTAFFRNNDLLIDRSGLTGEQRVALNPSIYLIKKRLNMLSKPDLTGALKLTAPNGLACVFQDNYANNAGFKTGLQITNTTNETYVGWCAVDDKTGELYIGDNYELKPNHTAPTLYFNFKE